MAEEDTTGELMKAVKDKIADLEDMQLVNKLDIINMKNELDRVSLTSAPTAETADKISELAKIAEKSDKLRKFADSVSDLEKLKADLQGAKPVDNTAFQTELEGLKKKMADLESAAPGGGPAPASGELKKLREEISEMRSTLDLKKDQSPVSGKMEKRLDDMEKSMRSIQTMKLGELTPQGLKDISERLDRIESSRPAPKGKGVSPDVMAGIVELRSKVEKLEKKGPGVSAGGIPDDISAKIDEIGKLSSDVESLRTMMLKQKEIAPKAAKGKKKGSDASSGDVDERLGAIEVSLSNFNILKNEFMNEKQEIAKLKHDINEVGSKNAGQASGDIDVRISELEKRIEGAPAPKKGAKAVGVSELKRKVEALEKKLSGPKAPAKGADVDEVESKLESVEASMTEQGEELVDLRDTQKKLEKMMTDTSKGPDEGELAKIRKEMKILTESVPRGMSKYFGDIKTRVEDIEKAVGKIKAEDLDSDKPDPFAADINIIKTKISELERKSGGAALAPDAVEELRKLHGQFPIEEFTKIKGRMTELEDKLTKASELAAGLQPIEMPQKEGEDIDIPPDIGRRIKTVERLVAGGASPEMVRGLETRLESLKATLGGQLKQETEQQLKVLERKMEDKMTKMELMKDDMIESTIEQLLAQPDNVGKIVDKKIERKLDELNKKVDSMDKTVSPADAKLRLVIKDVEEKEKEMDILKTSLKEMRAKYKEDLEAMEIELKTMNSKMGTVSTSVKAVEGAGATDLARDMEILKTKAEWLENTVQKFNLKPIYEKLQEIEDKIRTSHGYSPMVIE